MPSLEALLKTISNTNEDDFTSQHPNPVLVLEAYTNPQSSDSFQTVTAEQGAPLSQDVDAHLRDEAGVIPLLKKAQGKFSNMISVGRTASNDVQINSASVSKFHAYFIHTGDQAWYVQDADSSNGTYVNGQKISKEEPTELLDGITVQFSADTLYRFYKPRGLYRFLQDSLATDPSLNGNEREQ